MMKFKTLSYIKDENPLDLFINQNVREPSQQFSILVKWIKIS